MLYFGILPLQMAERSLIILHVNETFLNKIYKKRLFALFVVFISINCVRLPATLVLFGLLHGFDQVKHMYL